MKMTPTAELRREYHRKPATSIFHRKTAASYFSLHPWDQSLGGFIDYKLKWDKTLLKETMAMSSGRWSPTREQLQSLEEIYRRGIRTPTSDEIHQIVLKLRRFGRIEGKNVFYWFQNHKAREKQKNRRLQEQLNKFDLGSHSSSRSYAAPDITSPLKLQQEMKQTTVAAERSSSPFALSLDGFSADKVTEQIEEVGNGYEFKLFADDGDTRTLDLFPVVKRRNGVEVEEDYGIVGTGVPESENRFFEFIPLS